MTEGIPAAFLPDRLLERADLDRCADRLVPARDWAGAS